MKKIIFLFVTTLFLSGCSSPKTEIFDRFILATTFANNNKTKYDSLEMTSTVCLTLLYLDHNSNCFIYKRTANGPEFYKSILNKQEAEKFKNLVNNLKTKFPKESNLLTKISLSPLEDK